MNDLRLILLLAGVLLVIGIFLYYRWQQYQAQRGSAAKTDAGATREPYVEQPPGSAESAALEQDDYFPLSADEPADAFDPERQKIISLHVMAPEGRTFPAGAVVEALRDAGLKYGRHRIFHRQIPIGGEARTVFGVANMIEPGIFDLDHVADNWLIGITLFLVLPGPRHGVDAFADLLATARQLADRLGGEVKDETRSTLTKQTAHHIRESIIAFEVKTRQ